MDGTNSRAKGLSEGALYNTGVSVVYTSRADDVIEYYRVSGFRMDCGRDWTGTAEVSREHIVCIDHRLESAATFRECRGVRIRRRSGEKCH